MADSTGRPTDEDELRRRGGGMASGGSAVAEEGDMAFGVMATIGVLTGIIIAFMAFGGFFGGDDDKADDKGTEAAAADDGAREIEELDDGEDEADEEEAAPETTTTTAAPLPDPADAVVTVSSDGITLTGTVPDEATAQALLDEALLSFSEDAIVNELEVVDGAEPFTLTVTGEAADGGTFDQLSAGFATLGAAAGSYDDSGLTAAEPEGAAAVVTASQGGITLIGTVPDEATAQSLRDAAAAAYPEDRITDELEIVDGAEPFSLTVAGEATDPVLVGQVNTAFDAVGGSAGTYENTLEQVESSDVEAELNALDQILFQSGTATIIAESQPVVEAAAALMQANPDVAFEVGGHTDTRGSDESNQALSEARANAVVDALVALGVTNELTPVGYGESRPIEANDTTAELQQANRRIEFRVL